MSRHFVIYFFFLLITSCGQSQPSVKKHTDKWRDDITQLLKLGTHTADIMDSIKQTPEQARIAEKLQISMQDNYEWFVDYMQKVPEGSPMPYHEKMGISKAEYTQFLADSEKAEIISSGKEPLLIQKNGDIISFKGIGNLKVFDSIKIDLLHKQASFKSYILSDFDSIRVTDASNGLRSRWFGYSFAFESAKDLSAEDLKNLSSLNYSQFKLIIGQLENTRKPFLEFSGTVIENGEKTTEIKLPLVFD